MATSGMARKRNPAIFPNRQNGRWKTENRFSQLLCWDSGLKGKREKFFKDFCHKTVCRPKTSLSSYE
jgi:hypothetical protein